MRQREKINSFETTVIIFKAILSPILKTFKSTELLTKTSFFHYFRKRPKNGEGDKGDVKSMSARVAKHASKTLRKKCLYSELFWFAFSPIREKYGPE